MSSSQVCISALWLATTLIVTSYFTDRWTKIEGLSNYASTGLWSTCTEFDSSIYRNEKWITAVQGMGGAGIFLLFISLLLHLFADRSYGIRLSVTIFATISVILFIATAALYGKNSSRYYSFWFFVTGTALATVVVMFYWALEVRPGQRSSNF